MRGRVSRLQTGEHFAARVKASSSSASIAFDTLVGYLAQLKMRREIDLGWLADPAPNLTIACGISSASGAPRSYGHP
jgi:hypothetical protein